MLGMIGMKNMSGENMKNCAGFSEAFYGSVTVGERGQLVIPAEARAELGFQPGDKVLVMRHPVYKGLMVFKIEAVREFLDDFAANLARIEGEKGDQE
jgi:AbrB family looped-hinge helix DNA binding protein